MKIKLLFIIILISASCIKKKQINDLDIKSKINHETNQLDQKNNLKTADSIKERFHDTLNNKESPIKIISSKLLKNQYSDHKDIQLIYKNVSKKRIGAVRFEWYCKNSFNKPASGKFFFVKGKAEGDANVMVNPGKTTSHIWEDFSTDARTILYARAYFVAFSDGTNWELK